MAQSTMHKILRTRLKSVRQRYQFFSAILENIEDNELHTTKLVFSDKATFHLSDQVNRRNLRIWVSQNPHAVIKHKQGGPKANVICALSKQVSGFSFFPNAL
jgi:hypothetical protein